MQSASKSGPLKPLSSDWRAHLKQLLVNKIIWMFSSEDRTYWLKEITSTMVEMMMNKQTHFNEQLLKDTYLFVKEKYLNEAYNM